MSNGTEKIISELRQLKTIRARCQQIFELGCQQKLDHFSVHLDNLNAVVDAVHELMTQDYKNMAVPNHSRWRHFEAAEPNWAERLEQGSGGVGAREWLKRHCDLIVVSVLLDAGAGPQWTYTDPVSNKILSRSEGLGVASLRMFERGLFSSNPRNLFQADAAALSALTLQNLESGFQVSSENPMVGLEGRLALLGRLGEALRGRSQEFGGGDQARPGNMVDGIMKKASGSLDVSELWRLVIVGLQDIWPTEGRTHLHGVFLGDVWHHSKLGDKGKPEAFIPFHKLSQWLTYSLLEPFWAAGIKIEGQEELTGLPEYRNGGLFIDYEVIKPKREDIVRVPQSPSSECIIEWRALTVILLDKVATLLREKLGLSESDLSLAKVLEGGTWKAGRRVASSKRAGGTPPIQVVSDGTVF
jgi:hypothetical protein